MQTVMLVVQLLVAVALIGVILIQRTAQDGGGLMGGGSTMGGLFTARGSANILTRTTAVLATIFILNSLALGYIASSQHQSHSLLDQAPATAPASAPSPQPAPEAPKPSEPQVPMSQ
jgi:preprotein translocase subunit SecG